MEENLVNIGIWTAIILTGVGVVAAVLMPFINALSNPASLIKVLGGVAVLAVLFLIAWGVAGNEVTESYRSYNVTTGGTSKLVGGGLNMMFLLFTIALVGVVFSEIHKAIKS